MLTVVSKQHGCFPGTMLPTFLNVHINPLGGGVKTLPYLGLKRVLEL